jgi:hypothetical protein
MGKKVAMLRAYRLVYLESPEAPPKLWEWQQPYIHDLIVNARSFGTTRVEQRYFRDWEALARENTRVWEAHYRSRPLYDPIAGWEAFLTMYRELIRDVQAIGEAHPDWQSPASKHLE